MEKYWIHGKILSLDLNRVFEILCFKKSLKFKITIEIWNIGCYCMDCGCYCIVVILKINLLQFIHFNFVQIF